MSTSLLYHVWGVRDVHYRSVEFLNGTTVFHATINPKYVRCTCCRSYRVIGSGGNFRVFHLPPAGSRRIQMSVWIPRIECKSCKAIRQVKIPFADPKKHYTRSLERYVISLFPAMTIDEITRHTGLGWNTVKNIHKRHLHKKYKNIRLRKLRYIAIDEVCIGKGHKYLTIVMDLCSGAVIHIGEGKGGDALKPFWKRLKRSKAKIQAVATDMGKAYINAVMTYLPKADLVLDHFHVVKWFNEKLTKLRRDLYKEAEGMGKDLLKGLRWLILKNPENLKSHENLDKDQRHRLQEALALNEPLCKAYYMKEELRYLWKQPNKDTADRLLKCWITCARNSGVAVLKKAAKQLQLYRSALLRWYDHRISTGPLENMNGKIGTLQRRGYGWRDQEYFFLRIKHLHRSAYALTG